MKIVKGNRVTVEYEGCFENGEIFDTSKHGDHSHPLEFTVGSGEVIEGFDNAVIGMEKGEEKEFTLNPEDAYGNPDPKLCKEIPKDILPKGHEPKVGMTIVLGTPEGHQFPTKIVGVGVSTIKVDLNHPLAGKKLIFKIKVIDVKKASS